jgi:Crp-like helix-turn-helix domain
MPRHDIADYLGLTIETVSRMFAELKDMGTIKLESSRRVHILDMAKLRAMSEGIEDGAEMCFARPQVLRVGRVANARAAKLLAEPRNTHTDNSEDQRLKQRWLREVAATHEQNTKRDVLNAERGVCKALHGAGHNS